MVFLTILIYLLLSLEITQVIIILIESMSDESFFVACALTIFVPMYSSFIVVKEAVVTKKKSYLLILLIPIILFLIMLIFRDQIDAFIRDLLGPFPMKPQDAPMDVTSVWN